jgi:hypothetical protein
MPTPPPLSDRHWQVLRLIARGFTLKQMARALGISRHTVKAHIRVLYSRFAGTLERFALPRTVQSLATLAIGLGWLSLTDIAPSQPDSPDSKDAPDASPPHQP